MFREIVFDIETIGDIGDLSALKLTVASVYRYETNEYRSFEERELRDLWPLFERAERIIGFNSEHFDLPILQRYYGGDLSRLPHLDILKVVKQSTGSRFKLNDLAKATLQTEKSADGLKAMEWFNEGRLDLVKKYCEQDVKVTKELYEYGRKNRMLYYPKITGELAPFPVNFEPIAAASVYDRQLAGLNLTLPF